MVSVRTVALSAASPTTVGRGNRTMLLQRINALLGNPDTAGTARMVYGTAVYRENLLEHTAVGDICFITDFACEHVSADVKAGIKTVAYIFFDFEPQHPVARERLCYGKHTVFTVMGNGAYSPWDRRITIRHRSGDSIEIGV